MRPLRLPFREAIPDFAGTAESGESFSLQRYRTRQQNLLLMILHDARCEHCREMVEDLSAFRSAIESWDSAILILRTGAAGFDTPVPQAVDRSALGRLHSEGEAIDTVIAALDFRGRLMEGWSLRHPEQVDWKNIVESVKWVAIQEPECGTCVIAPGWEAEG
jgi:hypothetical protein